MAEKLSNIFHSILPKSSEEKKPASDESKNEEITLELKDEMTFEECQDLLENYKKVCNENDDTSPKNCKETIENLEKMCSK